jgi:hypothetical protein
VEICIAGLDTTPVNVPKWQFSHKPATEADEWSNLAPLNEEVLWHTPQSAVPVAICAIGLLTTVGDCPPWQVEQALVMPVWSILALVKVLVLVWQDSQGSKVGKWVAGLLTTPNDCPLWQDAHPPDMPTCKKLLTKKLVALI